MIVLTANSPDTRSTAIDLTSMGAIAALTLLPERRDDALAAALSPAEARRLPTSTLAVVLA